MGKRKSKGKAQAVPTAPAPPVLEEGQVQAWLCDDCGAVEDEFNASPLYECGNCGTIFNRENSADGDSARCPDCNKFSAKIADECCVSCEVGKVEEVIAVTNADGELEVFEKKNKEAEEVIPATREIVYMLDIAKELLVRFYPDWLLHQPWDNVRGNLHNKHANILLRSESGEADIVDLWDVPKGKWKYFLFRDASGHSAVVERHKAITFGDRMTELKKDLVMRRAMGDKDRVKFFDSEEEARTWAHQEWMLAKGRVQK